MSFFNLGRQVFYLSYILFLQPRYRNVKHINLEFAQDIEDKQLEIVKSKVGFAKSYKLACFHSFFFNFQSVQIPMWRLPHLISTFDLIIYHHLLGTIL